MKKEQFFKALHDTTPVLTGYLVLGIGFGMIMNNMGYGVLWSSAMSLFIYAGSMQYAAVGLITDGASLLTVTLTALAVNARHLFYGLSMLEPYRNAGAAKPYMIFTLTDETYSLVCGGDKDKKYCFFVSLLDHIYWVGSTALGALIGGLLHIDTEGIEFALTALFITVFVDQWMKSEHHFPAVSGVLISVICLLLFGKDGFLIPAMFGIALVLLLNMRREKEYE